MQPLPVFNAFFQDIVTPDASQELGVMVLGKVPTSGSRLRAHLRNWGPVEVELATLIDSGTDQESGKWSTWSYRPGSMRLIDRDAPVAEAPIEPADVWEVTRWGGRKGTEPRRLYHGADESIARRTYEALVSDIRQGEVKLIKGGTVVSITQAPRKTARCA